MATKSNTYLSTGFIQRKPVVFGVFNILITCVLLTACSSSGTRAPTIERGQPPSTKVDTHIVSSGETLYTIAWRYGLDYRQLAQANGIGSDFLIYSGQTLQLRYGAQSKPRVSSSSKSSISTQTSSRSAPQKSSIPSSKKSSPSVAVKKAPSQTGASNRSEKKAVSKSSTKTSVVSQGKVKWRWPSSGRVLTNFSTGKASNKGIDLSGKKGDSVLAAASGRIVYAGSGLRGYGKLVIIKHNDTYLSAYAHNSRIHVKEGQTVSIGQHIADIGSSGSRTDSAKLHFEIRRNGKPINPLKLLPKRKT